MLPDVLAQGLKVVFCGTAVADTSVRCGCYYAGRGNQFWPVLKRIGLIPTDFKPEYFLILPSHGIGLTDLVKFRCGRDLALRGEDYDAAGFREKIERYRPTVIAFNGKRAAETFLGRPVGYGFQQERIGDMFICVLPSTSGAARGFWDEKHWTDLAHFIT